MVAQKRALVNDLATIETIIARLQDAWSGMPTGKQRDTICELSRIAEHERWRLMAQAGSPAAQQFFVLLAQAEKAKAVGHE